MYKILYPAIQDWMFDYHTVLASKTKREENRDSKTVSNTILIPALFITHWKSRFLDTRYQNSVNICKRTEKEFSASVNNSISVEATLWKFPLLTMWNAIRTNMKWFNTKIISVTRALDYWIIPNACFRTNMVSSHTAINSVASVCLPRLLLIYLIERLCSVECRWHIFSTILWHCSTHY